MSTISIPPILSLLIGHIAAAVPRRARITFTELLIGAAATRGGHVTDAILAAGLSRSWTTYYWLLPRGRRDRLAGWQGLLRGGPRDIAARGAARGGGAKEAVRPAGLARGPR